MRIGFDLDGVLADLHGVFARKARALFPELESSALESQDAASSPPGEDDDAPSEDVPDPRPLPQLTAQQSRAVWKELCRTENFWESLDEIERGAIARLHAVAIERRWEIIFLTSRPHAPGHTVQRQSQRWLERHGFSLPSLFVVQQARGRIADSLQLDVVIDDRPEGCLDVVLESKARGILVWRGDMARVPGSAKRLGIGVVPTVAACLDVLVEADRSESSDGLVSRLKRLLGLQSR